MTRTAGLWGFTSMQTHHGWPSGRFPGSTPCSSTGAHLVHGGLPLPFAVQCHKRDPSLLQHEHSKTARKETHTPTPGALALSALGRGPLLRSIFRPCNRQPTHTWLPNCLFSSDGRVSPYQLGVGGYPDGRCLDGWMAGCPGTMAPAFQKVERGDDPPAHAPPPPLSRRPGRGVEMSVSVSACGLDGVIDLIAFVSPSVVGQQTSAERAMHTPHGNADGPLFSQGRYRYFTRIRADSVGT